MAAEIEPVKRITNPYTFELASTLVVTVDLCVVIFGLVGYHGEFYYIGWCMHFILAPR